MVCRKRLNAVWFTATLVVTLALGCSKGGSSSTANVDPKGESAHIAMAGMHVGKYLSENKGKVPKSTSEMTDWASKNSIAEDDLVSTRDKEPYEVHEVEQGPTKCLILVESKGAKGKKLIWKMPSPSKLGMEMEQADIEKNLEAHPGMGGGRPGGKSGGRPPG